jgi:hypothetical protein
MGIQRPDDNYQPSLQDLQGLDPFTLQIGAMQRLDPQLDNGPAYTSHNYDPMQHIDRTSGPGGMMNRNIDIHLRIAEIDSRTSQNRVR